MLNRQNSVLYMIEQAGRPVTRLEITKWAFLLAHETPSRGGPSFYQFLPYHLGPFSFCLYREIGGLVSDGYLVDSGNTWDIVESIPRPTGALSRSVREDAAGVVERFRGKDADELIDYVYRRFPWYTLNSKVRKLRSRPVARPAVYTVGYEGRLVDGFLNLLLRAGVQRLVDVRSNPVARRYGFHKRTLAGLCANVQIGYVHLPELGIPSELRRGLRTAGQYGALLSRYEAEILPQAGKAMERAAALIAERASALMCMEADPAKCHRTRLAKAVAGATGLPVRHLGVRDEIGI